MNYLVREATAADIPVLARYECEISLISFGDEAVSDPERHAAKLEKALSQKSGGMFVLEHCGRIAGWLWMDAKINFMTRETYANFRSFYVAADMRGGEAGEILLKKGLDWCEASGARRVVGKVAAGNVSMRALYKNAGFSATHITMELTL
ncbi:MAG: GNAT family N-acetyltransferase [Defluviitaleaceae bacterium]|nr:GNAT family N-acetyltransferase [Defluviitaleaceae bacterium]